MDDTEKDVSGSSILDVKAKESRRNFLKKAGKLAVYTPPAMMVLMKPSYATMNTSLFARPRSRRQRQHS